ncbi:hypothetical protein [Thermostilla marina]
MPDRRQHSENHRYPITPSPASPTFSRRSPAPYLSQGKVTGSPPIPPQEARQSGFRLGDGRLLRALGILKDKPQPTMQPAVPATEKAPRWWERLRPTIPRVTEKAGPAVPRSDGQITPLESLPAPTTGGMPSLYRGQMTPVRVQEPSASNPFEKAGNTLETWWNDLRSKVKRTFADLGKPLNAGGNRSSAFSPIPRGTSSTSVPPSIDPFSRRPEVWQPVSNGHSTSSRWLPPSRPTVPAARGGSGWQPLIVRTMP